MAEDGRSHRMGPDLSRSTVPSGALANGWAQFVSRPTEASRSATQSRGNRSVAPTTERPRRSPRVGPEAAQELAKTKVAQFERAFEVMGGCDGLAVQVLKAELEKAKAASKKPPLNVEIEETRKFITRSQRRLKEMEEERQVEEVLLSEAQQNLKRMWEAQEEKVPVEPEFPEDVVAQVTSLQ